MFHSICSKGMRKSVVIFIFLCLGIVNLAAQELAKSDVEAKQSQFKTSSRFMPTSRRIDREINKNVFAYKGEVALGLTASYGTLSSDNSDIFALLEHVNLSGSITTISPYVGYFYKDNACVGLRMGYTYMGGTLDNMDVNLGSDNDVGLSIPWIDANSNSFKLSAFLRNYAAIDEAGRFGVFSEFLSYIYLVQRAMLYCSQRGSISLYSHQQWVSILPLHILDSAHVVVF